MVRLPFKRLHLWHTICMVLIVNDCSLLILSIEGLFGFTRFFPTPQCNKHPHIAQTCLSDTKFAKSSLVKHISYPDFL